MNIYSICYDTLLRKKKNIGDNHKYFQITTQGSQSSRKVVSYKETRKGKKIRLEPSATSTKRKLKSNTLREENKEKTVWKQKPEK